MTRLILSTIVLTSLTPFDGNVPERKEVETGAAASAQPEVAAEGEEGDVLIMDEDEEDEELF